MILLQNKSSATSLVRLGTARHRIDAYSKNRIAKLLLRTIASSCRILHIYDAIIAKPLLSNPLSAPIPTKPGRLRCCLLLRI
jgi:hypothetical protein